MTTRNRRKERTAIGFLKFFSEANLENAIDAVAGLFCVALAYNHDVLEMSPLPKLLSI